MGELFLVGPLLLHLSFRPIVGLYSDRDLNRVKDDDHSTFDVQYVL